MADIPDPGDDCKRTCRVELCPYPPKGEKNYRVDREPHVHVDLLSHR